MTYHVFHNPLLDQICNSPYCQPNNSYDLSSENLLLDDELSKIDIFLYSHHLSGSYRIDIRIHIVLRFFFFGSQF